MRRVLQEDPEIISKQPATNESKQFSSNIKNFSQCCIYQFEINIPIHIFFSDEIKYLILFEIQPDLMNIH